MGAKHSNTTISNALTDKEIEYLQLALIQATKIGDFDKTTTLSRKLSSLDILIDDIPVIHYLMLQGIANPDNIDSYDSLIAYFFMHSSAYDRRESFDLSIFINSDDKFLFSHGDSVFGIKSNSVDSIEVDCTPAEFALQLAYLFQNNKYEHNAWKFNSKEYNDYVIEMLNDWYNFFKYIETNPQTLLPKYNTYSLFTDVTDYDSCEYQVAYPFDSSMYIDKGGQLPNPIPTAPPVAPIEYYD